MNESLRKLIKRHEGCSLIPYKCPALKRTIGWGHNFDANPLPSAVGEYLIRNGSITVEMAEQLLEDDISIATKGVRSLLPDFDKYSENRRNALVSMCFQIGVGTLSKFTTTIRMIKDGDWQAAADNLLLSKWAKKDTPKRAKEIIELLRRG